MSYSSQTHCCVQTRSFFPIGELSLRKVSPAVLDFNSSRKCDDKSHNIQSSITFQCGKTMVSFSPQHALLVSDSCEQSVTFAKLFVSFHHLAEQEEMSQIEKLYNIEAK